MINPHSNNKIKKKVISNGVNVDAALKSILKDIKTLGAESVKLTDALERVLAEDIYAGCDIPGFNNSAMDGYAVRYQDLTGAASRKPVILKAVDDIPAGVISKREVKKGQAARIMTGAAVPAGADAVVMVESTERIAHSAKRKAEELVKIFKPVKPGENIRQAGEDIKKGEPVFQKGTLLKSAHIGILASLGMAEAKVTRRPKVAVLATGDEIMDVKGRLKPGRIRNSNTYTLCAQIIKNGGTVKNLGIARDRSLELEKRIKQGFDCDLILTSGGVSVGDYDLVKVILTKIGTSIRFWKVATRPGKPLVFGMIKGIPVFGLPGNPVSSMVSFEVFIRPVISKMSGQKESIKKEADAFLEEDIKKKKGFRYFLRAQTRWENGMYFTRTTGPQGSGILKSMALANSLMILPEEAESIKKGTKVTVRFLD